MNQLDFKGQRAAVHGEHGRLDILGDNAGMVHRDKPDFDHSLAAKHRR